MIVRVRERKFQQVDVFSSQPMGGNPLAVVLDADDLDTATMAKFANWTNLSETTFLLKPTTPEADYRVHLYATAGITVRWLPYFGKLSCVVEFLWTA